jgi:transcription elongation GreA/GreB family factor
MSRAFVKEIDGDTFDLPDRPVSPHPNLVTAAGYAAIETAIASLRQERAATPADDRVAHARIARDLRYWNARRASARIMPPPDPALGQVQFGSTVTILRDDGRRQVFRIVGEDEADPAQGTLAYVAPLAHALLGKSVGDVVSIGVAEAEILAVA